MHSRSSPTWGRDIVRDNIQWALRSRADVGRWLRQRAQRQDELEDDLEDELEEEIEFELRAASKQDSDKGITEDTAKDTKKGIAAAAASP